MEEKKSGILEKASALFMKLGFKSLTMDDIARELGISKKTLYFYFEDKNDLVEQAVISHLNKNQEIVLSFCNKANNAIQEVQQSMQCVNIQMKDTHPSVIFDLQKYHPDAYELFKEHKFTFILDIIKSNITRGQKEGLYKTNMNCEIIARIYVARIDLLFNPEIFPREQFQFTDIYIEMMKYHLYALVTKKGNKLLDQIFNIPSTYENKI
jgi:AcrR family transcriptional regulator